MYLHVRIATIALMMEAMVSNFSSCGDPKAREPFHRLMFAELWGNVQFRRTMYDDGRSGSCFPRKNQNPHLFWIWRKFVEKLKSTHRVIYTYGQCPHRRSSPFRFFFDYQFRTARDRNVRMMIDGPVR
jgi:hypothetical protein